jgi:hypothetical protein
MAFTIYSKGEYQWITKIMGLLGDTASFQRHTESVLEDIKTVLFTLLTYLCTQTHTKLT